MADLLKRQNDISDICQGSAAEILELGIRNQSRMGTEGTSSAKRSVGHFRLGLNPSWH